jgi:hypothetical protein
MGCERHRLVFVDETGTTTKMTRLGVTRQTIQRLEQHDGVPPSRSQTLEDIQRAFESAGVEFIGSPDDGPGVRLVRKTRL